MSVDTDQTTLALPANKAPQRRYTGLCRPWRIAEPLQAVIGVPVASRTQITKLLWRYIKLRKLQDPRDRRFFYPDMLLGRVCGFGRLRCIAVAKFLGPHLKRL
jgi:chromatin remodeling complex protein RSC6